MASRRLIERYVLTTILPYALAALVLLTGVLFIQQTGRYFETIFREVMPASFVYGLALALLPTVLIFTLPAAVLCCTIIRQTSSPHAQDVSIRHPKSLSWCSRMR